MTVTRTRLQEAPAVAAERHAERVGVQRDRDRVRVAGYFGGRTGQACGVRQASLALGLPLGRVEEAVAVLLGAGFLEAAGLRPSRFGLVESFRRPGPEQRQQEQEQGAVS